MLLVSSNLWAAPSVAQMTQLPGGKVPGRQRIIRRSTDKPVLPLKTELKNFTDYRLVTQQKPGPQDWRQITATRRSDGMVFDIKVTLARSAKDATTRLAVDIGKRMVKYQKNGRGQRMIGDETWRFTAPHKTIFVLLARRGRGIVEVRLRSRPAKNPRGGMQLDPMGQPYVPPLKPTDIKFGEDQANLALTRMAAIGMTKDRPAKPKANSTKAKPAKVSPKKAIPKKAVSAKALPKKVVPQKLKQ